MKQRFFVNTLIVLLVGVCLVGSDAIAQTEYLKGGTKALQFQIQNDFLLRSFDGSTISLKKQKSRDRAYRLGLTLDASIADNNQSSSNSTGGTATNDEDANNQNVRVSLQKVFYAHAADRTFAYFGVGPTGGLARSKSDRTSTNTAGATMDYSNLSRTWSVGLIGSFGVEWFAHRNISLLAEYNTSAMISWLKQRSETSAPGGAASVQETKSTTYRLNDDGVRFGLAVYF